MIKLACIAYTRYILDIGQSEDWLALQIAIAPCLVSYSVIARQLYDDLETVKGERNKYWKWIETYVADDYIEAVSKEKGKTTVFCIKLG
jgi:thiaminase